MTMPFRRPDRREASSPPFGLAFNPPRFPETGQVTCGRLCDRFGAAPQGVRQATAEKEPQIFSRRRALVVRVQLGVGHGRRIDDRGLDTRGSRTWHAGNQRPHVRLYRLQNDGRGGRVHHPAVEDLRVVVLQGRQRGDLLPESSVAGAPPRLNVAAAMLNARQIQRGATEQRHGFRFAFAQVAGRDLAIGLYALRGVAEQHVRQLVKPRLMRHRFTASAAVAHMLQPPMVITQDDDQELRRLGLEAARGDPEAQAQLGARYLAGVGLPRDYVEALKWFDRAADQGVESAQAMLGVMYDQGLGVTQNNAEAAKWYRLAADQGAVLAQSRLGQMYLVGQGVIQDWAEAVRWLRPAAEEGNADAQFALGSMYTIDGGGLRADSVEAHKWVILAAGRAEGERQKKYAAALYELTKLRTPAQIAEAQKRAREWQEAFERRQQ